MTMDFRIDFRGIGSVVPVKVIRLYPLAAQVNPDIEFYVRS